MFQVKDCDLGGYENLVGRSISSEHLCSGEMILLTQLAKANQSRLSPVLVAVVAKTAADSDRRHPTLQRAITAYLRMRTVLKYSFCESSVAAPSSSS